MKAKLQSVVKEAMKAQDKVRLEAARMLLAAIQYEEMQRKVDSLPDDAVTAVLQREVNRRKEELEFAQQAGRSDSIERVNKEIKLIEEFLPSQLSSEELEKIIVNLKSETPGINMGSVMKLLKERHAGQYDGKAASEIAKRVLG